MDARRRFSTDVSVLITGDEISDHTDTRWRDLRANALWLEYFCHTKEVGYCYWF